MDEMTVRMMDTTTPALRRMWNLCYVTFLQNFLRYIVYLTNNNIGKSELHDSVKQCAIELFLMIFKQHLVSCLWSVLTI